MRRMRPARAAAQRVLGRYVRGRVRARLTATEPHPCSADGDRYRTAVGWSNGTTGVQPMRSTSSSDGGVSTTAASR
jgi:hypothetical protein